MRDALEPILIVAPAFWFIAVLATFTAGIANMDNVCKSPTQRIELIVPGKIIGCFLREPLLPKEVKP